MKIRTPRVDQVSKELSDRKITYLAVEKGDVEEMLVEIETPSGKVATLGHWNHSVSLRYASLDEGEQVNAIYNRLKFFPAKMETDETVVVEVWGKWIGLGRIAGTSDPLSREMAGIWVDEEYRNRGIARKIVSLLATSIQKLAPSHNIFCVPFSKLDGFYKQFDFLPYDVNAADVPESLRSKFSICATRFAETPCSLLKYQPSHTSSTRTN
jgi:ribosomal protein S18 acetylase RimI-like enzyme